MEKNYLDILEESLKQKIAVLDEIIEYDRKQEEMLKEGEAPLEEFDAYVDKKDVLIQKLSGLDDGFETVYEHVRVELKENKELYKAQITEMQDLISKITDRSVLIQAQEARNKTLVEQYIRGQRNKIAESRVNSRKAFEYYKNLSKSNSNPYSGFMDQKK